MTTLKLPWPPSVNHYWRHWRGRTLLSKDGRKYRSEIKAIIWVWAERLRFGTLSGELRIKAIYYPPDNRKRDLDNLWKAIGDSLQHAGVYEDDRQIRSSYQEFGEVRKPNGEVIVTIGPLEQGDTDGDGTT